MVGSLVAAGIWPAYVVPPALVRNLKEKATRDQGPTGPPEQPVQSGIAGILDSTGSY